MNSDPTSLERLHDVILPPPVPWWPLAPGWYWVLGFVLVGLLVFLFQAFLSWQRNCYRREALTELARQRSTFGDPAQRPAACRTIAELLKRAALSVWPRTRVASLTGAEWLAFLDQTGRMTGFGQGKGAKLIAATYDSRLARELSEKDLNEIATLADRWLKHHQVRDETAL
jgi:hypothetical protein